MGLTEKDRLDSERISKRLLRALDMNNPGTHRFLIESYLQEAIVYGRTGHWVLEEAAAKITGGGQ